MAVASINLSALAILVTGLASSCNISDDNHKLAAQGACQIIEKFEKDITFDMTMETFTLNDGTVVRLNEQFLKDLNRTDFKVNDKLIAIDPNLENQGKAQAFYDQTIDFFGSQANLEKATIANQEINGVIHAEFGRRLLEDNVLIRNQTARPVYHFIKGDRGELTLFLREENPLALIDDIEKIVGSLYYDVKINLADATLDGTKVATKFNSTVIIDVNL